MSTAHKADPLVEAAWRDRQQAQALLQRGP